jgi:hypothetical protein
MNSGCPWTTPHHPRLTPRGTLNEGQFRKDTFVEVGGRGQKENQHVYLMGF